MLGAAGYRRADRRHVIRWFRKRRVLHLRCQFTLSNPALCPPANKVTEIIDHWLEDERATVTLCLYNFTPEARHGVTPEQWQAILNHPFSKGDPARAGKLAISLGRHAGSQRMLDWQKGWAKERLEIIAKYKNNPRVIIQPDNEILDWMPVHPFPAEPQAYDLKSFAESIGLNPIEGAAEKQRAEIDAYIRSLGFTLDELVDVHAYHGWNGTRSTQYLLGFNGEEFNVGELNATSKHPQCLSEVLRVGVDTASRRPRVVYYHTHALCFQGFKRAATSEVYDQFKSPELALSWVNGVVPEHEGACVLNPKIDEAVSALALVLAMGEFEPVLTF